MAGTNQGIIEPPIDSLLEKVDSKYQLVIYAAKRARQINDYYSDLHEGNLFDHVGPTADSTIEDQPLTIALPDITAIANVRGHGSFGVVHFDSHADTAPGLPDARTSSATPALRLTPTSDICSTPWVFSRLSTSADAPVSVNCSARPGRVPLSQGATALKPAGKTVTWSCQDCGVWPRP